MKKTHFLGLLVLALSIQTLNAQVAQTRNWLFGDMQSINTNFTPYSLNTFTPITAVHEGSVSQSDDQGNLLFFYDGIQIYEGANLNTVMTGGSHPLLIINDQNDNSITSADGAISIQDPKDCNRFYLFTSGVHSQQLFLQFFIIDFNTNPNGVVTYGGQLSNVPISEGITAALHANSEDVWVIVHQRQSNNFLSFLVTAGGPQLTPVMSTAGPILSAAGGAGCLKTNIDGDLLVHSSLWDNVISLYDFNSNLGTITNSVIPFTPPGPAIIFNPYGVEFSPNSDFLYYTEVWWNTARIIKHDLVNDVQVQSINHPFPSNGYEYGDLQLTENNQIIVADYLGTTIIDSPNNPGLMTLFNGPALNFAPMNAIGLPTFPPYLFGNVYTSPDCISENFCKILDDGEAGNGYGRTIKSTTDGGYLVGGFGSNSFGFANSWLTKFSYNDCHESDIFGNIDDIDETFSDVIEGNPFGTNAGSYFVTGSTNNTNTIMQNNSNLVLAKIDAGNFSINWSVQFDIFDKEEATKIIETNNGELILAGTGNNGGENLLFVRIDPSNGAIIGSPRTFGNYNPSRREVLRDIALIPGTNNLVAVGERGNAGSRHPMILTFTDQLTLFSEIILLYGSNDSYQSVEIVGDKIYAAGRSNGRNGTDFDILISEYDFTLAHIRSFFYGTEDNNERARDMFGYTDEYGESSLYLGGFSSPFGIANDLDGILMRVSLPDMQFQEVQKSTRNELDIFTSISHFNQFGEKVLATGWIEKSQGGDREIFIVKFDNSEFLNSCCTNGIEYGRYKFKPIFINDGDPTSWNSDWLDYMPWESKHELLEICKEGENEQRSFELISLLKDGQDFVIFPNPAKSSITLSSEGLKDKLLTISIFNIHGQLIFEKPNIPIVNEELFYSINTSDFSEGNYIISITGDQTFVNEKLIIQN
ncbi:MAG: T9SS type A sorting domain-containing protein [Bacteroidota bacterium]